MQSKIIEDEIILKKSVLFFSDSKDLPTFGTELEISQIF